MSLLASACGDQLAPYFSQLVDVLFQFIRMQYSSERSILQSQAVGEVGMVMLQSYDIGCVYRTDTLGILARTIGESCFRPIAQECIATGIVCKPFKCGPFMWDPLCEPLNVDPLS